MATPTLEQKRALLMVVDMITDAIKVAGPLGAPAGPMYAAMMAHGCTLSQFDSITGAMVRLGKLRRQGDLFFIGAAR